MSQRMSAIVWLILSLGCGLFTLLLFVGGGYAIWHTHGNVQKCEESIEEDEREQKLPKTRLIGGRMEEIQKRLEARDAEKAELVKYRYYAIGATVMGVVPGLMTLAFMAMFFMKWLKKSPAESDEEEEADEPQNEPEAPKKTKRKPA